MPKQLKKNVTRFLPVFQNGFRIILNPILGIIFSYVIVTYFSKDLWGYFVEYLLLFFIISIICNWGSVTYLIRAFSQNPKNIIIDWQHSFTARIPICLICTISVFFFFELYIALFMMLWIISTFIYHSFFPVIFYNRDYIKSISIEIIGFFTLIIQLFIFKNYLDLALLLWSYAFSVAVKAIMSLIYYHPFLRIKKGAFNFKVLKLSFPFFILGITGFLQSKVDVYTYSFFYDAKALGEYQIISGLFVFAGSLIAILSFPFVKNFYRLKIKSIESLKKSMIKYGVVINLLVLGIIYLILFFGFNIKLSMLQICIGYFISFPSYVYTTHIYNLIKNKREAKVIQIGLYSVIINLLISLFLLYLGYNVTGVLFANAIAQLFCMFYSIKFKINA